MKNESDLQYHLRLKLQTAGAVVLNVHGSLMQGKGWPDLHVCSRIWTGWLELKWENKRVEPIQQKRLRDFRDRGAPAYVLRCFEDGTCYLQFENGNLISSFPIKKEGPEILHYLKAQPIK